MKKIMTAFAIAAMAALVLSVVLPAYASEGKTMTWTGWISDSNCGAKGMSAGHKDCAMKCVKEKGAKWVFVNTKDKKVYTIHNQDGVDADKNLGMEVKVTGHLMKDGTLHVDSIVPASGSM